MSPQGVTAPVSIHSDNQAESARAACRDTCDGILHHHGAAGSTPSNWAARRNVSGAGLPGRWSDWRPGHPRAPRTGRGCPRPATLARSCCSMTPRRCGCPPREGVGPGRPTRDRPRPHPGRSLPSPVHPCGCRDHRPYPRSSGPPAFLGERDFPGGQKAPHAFIPKLAVHVQLVIGIDVELKRLLPAARRLRKSSNIVFQQLEWILAVDVRTPSRSNRTASNWPGAIGLCEGLMACLPGAMSAALEGEMFVSLSDVRALRSGSVLQLGEPLQKDGSPVLLVKSGPKRP